MLLHCDLLRTYIHVRFQRGLYYVPNNGRCVVNDYNSAPIDNIIPIIGTYLPIKYFKSNGKAE